MNYTQFKKKIHSFYKKNHRSFPWRTTHDPYAILLSEIMLQQTQTQRVIEKYTEWLNKFPTINALARAPLQEVLSTWKGLGYNRRALALHRLAKTVVNDFQGVLPDHYEELLSLPGIGPYTAGAVMAFAYNKAFPIIETNIRTVYIHEFFGSNHGEIHDSELMELITKTLDTKNPRTWYYALMDYGAYLKKAYGNANRRSIHYAKQTHFIGSNRQIRSLILHRITESQASHKAIVAAVRRAQHDASLERITKNITDLEREGFIIKVKDRYMIA